MRFFPRLLISLLCLCMAWQGLAQIPGKKKSIKPIQKTQRHEEIDFEGITFPDGLIERTYNFVLPPESAVSPYRTTIISGTLPPGLVLNQRTGGIEGQPTQVGEWNLSLRLIDARNKTGTLNGLLRVWRALTVGEHGTFKGSDGLQMAINMLKDMDEIRFEQGTIDCYGVLIPYNKIFEHSIKLSGGWNSDFNIRADSHNTTILDGKGRGNRMLIFENPHGSIFLESLTFLNSKGGAVSMVTEHGTFYFKNCTFNNNSAPYGGATSCGTLTEGRRPDPHCNATYANCIFSNNSTEMGTRGGFDPQDYALGGAVFGDGTFNGCIFTNNSARGEGGAVFGGGTFNNCNFTNNSATKGGAISTYRGVFNNCNFYSNRARKNGGAMDGTGDFNNCVLFGNNASNGGAISGHGTFIDCKFVKNVAENGGAVNALYSDGSIINCTLYGNYAITGGAISGGGNIINSIFFKNSIFINKNYINNDINVAGKLDIDYSILTQIIGAANFKEHNIIGDPKFVDAESGDFHLRPDSPCIGKGKSGNMGAYTNLKLIIGDKTTENVAKTTLDAEFPAFSIQSLDDQTVTFTNASFKGKYLLIDFWATWCGPCLHEMAQFHATYEKFKGKGLQALSLSFDNKAQDVAIYRANPTHSMPWNHAFVEGGFASPLAKALDVKGIPSLFLVGPDGKILATGKELRGDKLGMTLERFLGKP